MGLLTPGGGTRQQTSLNRFSFGLWRRCSVAFFVLATVMSLIALPRNEDEAELPG